MKSRQGRGCPNKGREVKSHARPTSRVYNCEGQLLQGQGKLKKKEGSLGSKEEDMIATLAYPVTPVSRERETKLARPSPSPRIQISKRTRKLVKAAKTPDSDSSRE